MMFCFFFFKQKTAYELRISDWSSDVCSSDLSGSYAIHVTSLKEARFKTTVPQQRDFSCGSAAVATLLTYQYGQPVTEAEVFRYMYDHGDQARIRKEGFSLLDIRGYLQS